MRLRRFFAMLFLVSCVMGLSGCAGGENTIGAKETTGGYEDKLDRTDEGFVLVWNDEFDGEKLDLTKWDYQYGNGGEYGNSGWGNDEWQFYLSREENVRVEDGKLIITAMKEGNVYTSGRIRTYTNAGEALFSTTYGRVEARIKCPIGDGIWPAFWMLPVDSSIYGTWAASGEIDIMERLNNDTFAYQTVHSYYTKVLEIKDNPPYYKTGEIKPDDYNVFAVELHQDSLVFFINENRTFCYPRIETDKKGQYPFDKPYYLMIDQQLGGEWVGEVAMEDLPVEMEIDWVRFYQKK